MSCDTALHNVTTTIEKALKRKHSALVVFLDISGAFSNVATKNMIRALASKGAEKQIVIWTKHLLTGRTATATLGGVQVDRRITGGVAEGGIGSPPLFNCSGSEALDRLQERTTVEGHAFADDLNTIKTGTNTTQMGAEMQVALDTLSEWAVENNLQFNASKTKAMLFTRQTKNVVKPILTMNGNIIEYVDTFKYLGIIFDSKLSWQPHIKALANKAKATTFITRRMVGKQWGLNPRTVRWMYTAIIRPILTYGCVAWVSGLRRKDNVNKLTQVQRLACKMMTGCMRSTPTAGMEVILGLTPIEIHITEAALATTTRLHRTGHWKDTENSSPNSHTAILNAIRNEIPELQFPQDKVRKSTKDTNHFKVEISDRQHFLENRIRPMPWDPGILNCFTDGSKTETGTGAAYIMKSHNFESQDYMHLGEHATVFQAEITAINMASLTILEADIRDHQIHYWIDSQGAIKSLNNYITQHKCVAECKRLLNKIAENNTTTLHWIPGHTGQLGNGIADNLAKLGAEYPDEGLEPRIPVSNCTITTFLKNWSKEQHQQKWQNSTDYRQTKLVLPDTNHRWRKQADKLDKTDLRILTQLITGHANLKRHLHIMGYVDSPNCQLCGEEQTAIHILTECPQLAGPRTAILGRPQINHKDLKDYRMEKLLRFAHETELWNYD